MRRLLSILLLAAAPLAGAQVPENYQATVSVADQSPTARDKALRIALMQVLTQVSGADPGTRAAPILTRANTLVRSVGYDGSGAELQLTAVFEPGAIDTALRQQGLAVNGVTAATLEAVNLSVGGIDSAQTYARVLAHLRAQPGVRNLAVVAAHDSTLQVTLRAEGGAARLAGALGVGSVLRRDPQQPDAMAFVVKR